MPIQVLPPSVTATTMTPAQAKAWLAQFAAAYAAAYAELLPPAVTWPTFAKKLNDDSSGPISEILQEASSAPNWSDNARQILQTAQQDILSAITQGSVLLSGAKAMTGLSSLDIAGQTKAISDLVDALASGGAGGSAGLTATSMGLSVTPTLPAEGTNPAADAQLRLQALVKALSAGDAPSAQTALNALAGDIQAIASSGSKSATNIAPTGTVATSTAVATGLGALAAGGIAGAFFGHAVGSGLLLAGETAAGESTTRRRKKKRARR